MKIELIRRVVIFLIFIFLMSCKNTLHIKNYEILKGEWQTVKFFHKDENLLADEYIIIGFQNENHLWFMDDKNFTHSDYKIYKDSTTLKIDLINCEDKRFIGNYNFHLDTIGEDRESHFLKIILDSEDTYIEAIRHKLKYTEPPSDLIINK